MDFELSEEQNMLKDSVDRFVKDNYDTKTRHELANSALGFSKENWAQFAEMGWLGMPFSEDQGGFGGTPVETAVMMESLGAGLVLEPLLSTIMLGGKLIENAGSDAQKSEILPAVIGGEMLLTLAYNEAKSRYNLADIATTAERTDGGYVINGRKIVVSNGASANKIIVSCRSSGSQADEDGISLLIVDQDALGMTRKDYRTLDGHRASDIEFNNVKVASEALIGEEGQGFTALEKTIDQATCALCAEAVGAMRAVNAITQDYIMTRQQFGSAIGSNQVLQHRLVDMNIATEEAKSMTDAAAMQADTDQRRMVTSATKAKIGEAGLFVGAQGIQLHGGIGMTDEYSIGHFYKRLMAVEMLFGNADYHRSRFSQLT